jgi:hypothetical protein
MSWNINIIGKREDVKAALAGEAGKSLPQPLRDAVALIADAGKTQGSTPALIHVKSSGHYDPAWASNVYEFSVTPVDLAPPAPPPTASAGS